MFDPLQCRFNLAPPVDAAIEVEMIEPGRKRALVQEVDDCAGGFLAVLARIGDEDPWCCVGLCEVDRPHLGCFQQRPAHDHAVPTNSGALAAFRYHVMVLWMRTLRRRSQKDRTGWDRINRLADQWLPKPRILHPWPTQRFAVKHPRWEPDAGMPHVRFCAGGAQ